MHRATQDRSPIRRLLSTAGDAAIILAISALLIIAIEIGVRQFSSIQLLGIDRHLFTERRFGDSYGNTPLTSSSAFEQIVHTDENGYRVPSPGYRYPAHPARRILIIGDSVTFGVGVLEEQTFAGLLRRAHPDWTIENAGVAGYSARDYLNVSTHILERRKSYDKIVIVICLNDILYNTAADIEGTFQRKNESFLFRLKNLSGLQALNDFIKTRSKLYLLLKNLLFDSSEAHFREVQAAFNSGLVSNLHPLGAAITRLRSEGLDVTVFIAPYEYQLRSMTGNRDAANDVQVRKNTILAPQKKVSASLAKMGIEVIDLLDCLVSRGAQSSRELFVPFDAMHFSKSGHSLAYACIERGIKDP